MHNFLAGLAYVAIVMAPCVVALTTWLRDLSCSRLARGALATPCAWSACNAWNATLPLRQEKCAAKPEIPRAGARSGANPSSYTGSLWRCGEGRGVLGLVWSGEISL